MPRRPQPDSRRTSMTSTIPTRAVTHNRVHPLRNRHHVVAPPCACPRLRPRRCSPPSASAGPWPADAIATHTGLSIATVNPPGQRPAGCGTAARASRPRRPRCDRPSAHSGRDQPRAVPDPRPAHRRPHNQHRGQRPVRPDPRCGSRRRLPGGSQSTALAALADSARRHLGRWHRRRPLWVGWPSAAWSTAPPDRWTTPSQLGRLAQSPVRRAVPVSVASHVDAMAGAELLLGSRPARGPTTPAASTSTHARPWASALVIGGRVHTPPAVPAPSPGCPCSPTCWPAGGHLGVDGQRRAVVAAARKAAIPPATGPNLTIAALARLARRDGTGTPAARTEPAGRTGTRVLGGAVALLRDLLSPDDLVVGGQAFTRYPRAFPMCATRVRRALAAGCA